MNAKTRGGALLIKRHIFSIVNNGIEYIELKENILSYLEYQSINGYPFGELVIIHYEMFYGEENEDIYEVAAAIELLVLASNILDDVQDDDTESKPWSKEPALALNILVTLLFLSIQVVKNCNFKYKEKAISLILEYGVKSLHGQYKDILNICCEEKDYLEMVQEKSGTLVALSCLVGTVLATGNKIKEVETYAIHIGVLGQIENDLADIQNWSEKNDILNKKISLPIIFLLNHPDKSIDFLRDYYSGKIGPSEIILKKEFITRKIDKFGARTYAKVIKEIYRNKIITVLEKMEVNKSSLLELIKSI